MASSPEHRGESVRISWLLGGQRGGAKQSCTFTGPPEGRLKLALAAKALVESRRHDITREECYEAILGRPIVVDEVTPTFKMWAAQWIEELRVTKRVQDDVRHRYERSLQQRAMPRFGHKRLPDITREDIRDWVSDLKATRVTYGNKNRRTTGGLIKASTVTSHFLVTYSCLAAAVPKWITANPAARLSGERRNAFGLPVIGPPEGMFLTAEEVTLILANCPPEIHDMVYVASRTGMRIGELIALEARHVVFPREGGATILVRQAVKNTKKIGEPKSPASKRDITVVGEAARMLTARVQGRRPSALVFPTVTGRLWLTANLRMRYWYPAVAMASCCPEHPPATTLSRSSRSRPVRQSDFPISTCGCPGVLSRWPRFHDLRHTHASVLVANGWHFKKIQRRLGHARFQTTMDRYSHLADLGDADELEGLEDFFSARQQAGGHARQRLGVPRQRVSRSVVRRRAR